MEPDCAFYVGDRARGLREALREGEEAAAAYIVRNAPDLVVEVEITNVDEGKIARYADLGVRELWRLRGSRKSAVLGVDFLVLRKGATPRRLDASEVLHGLTAADVGEAVQSTRLSVTLNERVEAVARIVPPPPAPEHPRARGGRNVCTLRAGARTGRSDRLNQRRPALPATVDAVGCMVTALETPGHGLEIRSGFVPECRIA